MYIINCRTMSYFQFIFTLILLISDECFSDVSHLVSNYNVETTTVPTLNDPYSFHYKAGRYPGNIDRYQYESGDGTGTIHGTYSYIDPKFKIRTVDYTADKNGFHPILKNYDDIMMTPQDTDAVKIEKEKHYQLYQQISNANANPQTIYDNLPKESASVLRAKEKHFQLFNKIAKEHQVIAAQRDAQRLLATQDTSITNNYQHPIVY